MNRRFSYTLVWVLIGLSILAVAQDGSGKRWIGTWAAAPQPPTPANVKAQPAEIYQAPSPAQIVAQMRKQRGQWADR